MNHLGQSLQYFLAEIGIKEDDSGVLVLPASAIFNCQITASALLVTWNTFFEREITILDCFWHTTLTGYYIKKATKKKGPRQKTLCTIELFVKYYP